MKRWEWGFGIRDWGMGSREWGLGAWESGMGNRDRDRGRDRELGAVGGQQAAIWLISVKMNVYKEGL